MNACDTTSLVQLLRFSILFGGKFYKRLQVLHGSGLKGNGLMHLLCKFHTRACYPWQVMLT